MTSLIRFRFPCWCANLIGLSLQELPQSLNILPSSIKQEVKRRLKFRTYFRYSLLICGILLLLGLAVLKNFDNKIRYRDKLKIELAKITQEAKPLEDLEKRFRFLEKNSKRKNSIVDMLYELHQILPTQIFLVSLEYEEDNQLLLRGQAPQLNSVFECVAQLEKSAVFKEFSIKVCYATEKKAQRGEIVEFEIVCLKER